MIFTYQFVFQIIPVIFHIEKGWSRSKTRVRSTKTEAPRNPPPAADICEKTPTEAKIFRRVFEEFCHRDSARRSDARSGFLVPHGVQENFGCFVVAASVLGMDEKNRSC